MTVGGVRFLVDYKSGSEFRRARDFARYEPEVLTAFCHAVRRGRIVYDIGSAIGLYALLAAKANPGATVYAFEPQANNYQAILTNIRLNQLANIKVMNVAVGDENGEAVLEQRGGGEIAGLGTHRIRPRAGAGMPRVRVTTIDDLIAVGELPPPDVIKMDIEGFEVRAVRGMRRTLRHHRPELLLEVHPEAISELGDDPAEINALFTGLGYDEQVLHKPSSKPGERGRFHVRYAASHPTGNERDALEAVGR